MLRNTNLHNFYIECLEKLHLLRNIEENAKLELTTKNVLRNDLYNSIKRTFINLINNFSVESRNKTLDFIISAHTQSLNVIEEMLKNKSTNKIYLINIIEAFNKSVIGCRKLTITYKTDYHFISRLESHLETITIEINTKQQLLESVLVGD